MCGIAGLLALGGGAPPSDAYLRAMADTMAHRGPDGSGTWVAAGGPVGFTHRRLAIIDLSKRAAQPMHDTSGRYTIVLNGEIYNHAEIRAELEAAGHRAWNTDHSDTEVVLEAFAEWGIDCLARFRGMFAFALWDSVARELWLVRDRIGVKPLYYAEHHGRFVFASEIKALLADPEFHRSVDEESLFHFLTFMSVPAPGTMFSGVAKLPPAHWLRIRPDGSRTIRRYWDVWDHVEPLAGVSDDEIAERLIAELRAAVKYRKVSDRPVGTFLSGGIDSSTNAALFSEDASEPVHTFTVGYRGEHPSYENETEQARFMAAKVGAVHREVMLSPDDVLEFLPRLAFHQDEPISDPVCVPLYFVSKLARDSGVVVCQVGEGADELFHGYRSWAAYRKLQRLNDLLPGSWARRASSGVIGALPGVRGSWSELAARGARGEPVFWGAVSLFTDDEKRRLLAGPVAARLGGLSSYDAVRPVRERFEQAAWEPSAVNWMTYSDLQHRLPELLLMRVDKMSMAVGLEGRVPFLDHEFVTLAMSIPSAAKIRDGVPKSIFKKAVRGVIPDELIDRKKQGFGMPMADWIDGVMAAGGDHVIAEFVRRSELFDSKRIEQETRSNDLRRRWTILNLALWWHEFMEGSAAEALERARAGVAG